MLDRLYKFFTSLRLTVVLLAVGLILVFWGTIAQVNVGLYKAQNEFFRSFFIFWSPAGSSFRLPIFPGGYLVGGLLLINLFSAHLRYYQPGKKKWGIVLIHLGVVLLLLGQLLTDVLSTESMMHLRNGETKNYSEASMAYELAIVDTTDPTRDQVVAIPSPLLTQGGDVTHADLPFTVRVKTFHGNSSLTEKPAEGYTEVKVTAGVGSGIWWRALPHVTKMDERDMPSGIVELLTPQASFGTYLVSGFLSHPQEFKHNGRTYQLALRPTRYYKPFNLHLVEFKHDRYAGTDIPKNFSSRVRLRQPDTGEDREVLIYMNNPLRYAGETFYQASFDKDDQGTVLQVVHNPSWLTPYFACVMVAAGMVLQFMTHLVRFASKRKSA
ncbi:MAG: cytochrome c biogenesis protein ResB [Verrucomicrobiota bacterium]|nr:cytochrome c biogenesis protein ResB [Limisphaerales bacterium]